MNAAVANRWSDRLTPAGYILGGICLLAVAVRLVGLQWGLPNGARWYSYHPDERQVVAAVLPLDFLGGQFNPHFFNYPSLYIYLTYLLHGLLASVHLLPPLTEQNAVWLYPHNVLVAGRMVTALLGATTVVPVYLLGRKMAGPGSGLLAAALMAMLPGHVQHSHFATVDVPCTAFATWALWHSVVLTDCDATRRMRRCLMAGALAGLAAATKYNGALVLASPIVACALLHTPGREKARLIGSFILAAMTAFMVGCPYSVLSFSEFWGRGVNGFAYELLVHPRQGSGDIFTGSGNGWWFHLTYNLPFVTTWPVLLASAAGLLLLVRSRAPEQWPLLCWVALFAFSLGFSQVRFMRYTLPMVPALCVLAALPLRSLLGTPMRLGFLTVPAVLLALCAGVGCCNVLAPFTATDPRDRAAAFLLPRLINRFTGVAMANPPWFWSPPLTPQDSPPGARPLPAPTAFRREVIGFNLDQLRAADCTWLVMSEFEWRDPQRLGDPQFARFNGELQQRFKRPRVFKTEAWCVLPGRQLVPHDYLYTNPEVRIYERRH